MCCCRHDQFKSYRFVLASAGYLMQLLICEKPVVNLTIFPTMCHAVMTVFDQVRALSCVVRLSHKQMQTEVFEIPE